MMQRGECVAETQIEQKADGCRVMVHCPWEDSQGGCLLGGIDLGTYRARVSQTPGLTQQGAQTAAPDVQIATRATCKNRQRRA